MHQFNTIFNQFLQLIPKNELNKLISRYNGDRYVKHFTTWGFLHIPRKAVVFGVI
ncbi:MAG: DUF4372 domain-containing protein [Candidatus Margulisbacteria bacterium]|nr:DUF4372 domain-containing protein [Candidatus Margulisiibacteriota bacterium]